MLGGIYAYKVLNRWLLDKGSQLPSGSVWSDYRSDFKL
ncbi:hypothetical protein JCM19240_4870 [Vibrio maritimus]|uniref:Uncharacterized protein n=1 Tax=Vibrio maritimus TaxID=990268 RepID=A0A090T7J0_9VIBR|nr:hypothetical protein JCM19240_4870 [Vibrio maritimus]